MALTLRNLSTAVLAAAFLFPSPASADVTGAVGGVRSPASGTLELSVVAASDAELVSATATIDGVVLAGAPYEAGACRPGSSAGCPASVALHVATTGVADGPHRLDVTITDAAGDRLVIARSIEIDNTPTVWTPTVTVDIGSGAILPAPSRSRLTPTAGGAWTCAAPRLSIGLVERAYRVRRGVALLLAGRPYRFEGRLTCRVNGRRRPARRGTRVRFLNRIGRRLVTRPALLVRARGRFATTVTFRRSRVLIFRLRGAGGRLVAVRVPIRVVERRR